MKSWTATARNIEVTVFREDPILNVLAHGSHINTEDGRVRLNFPDKEPWELEETCTLDVADRGGITLEEVGQILNLTRERIRQVEVAGLSQVRAEFLTQGMDEDTVLEGVHDSDAQDPFEA